MKRERDDDFELGNEREEAIAKRAAWLVEQKLYQEVGKVATRGLLYALGMAGLALLAWLGAHKALML